ncbi:hypothetical protein KIW84_031195 [Lathyrus oleraceus]|uniref:Retrovirus-related Pol polyprotein from transposon TNT 1-94-like beta-barrel domain-containing protein n=1 Tax=Pisum sativum TaxID=3888 RepID=A0A9D4XQ32_PEA|nr:hypothetical protein KIW84_031195 [Pisum sativum]
MVMENLLRSREYLVVFESGYIQPTTKDIDQLSVDALQSSLLVHEQKFKGDRGEEHALEVTHEGYGGRGRGKAAFRGGRGQEEMVLMAYTDMLGGDRDDVWFIDSGCSNHMCGDSSLFCDLEKGFNKVVRLGNYASMNVIGKGSVRLTIKGVNHLVWDVYYVPGLKNNLLSVGHLVWDVYYVPRSGCHLEEEEQWNWEKIFEDDRRFDLEWEDGNSEEVEDFDDGSEEENIASPIRDESSDGNEEDESAPPMTPRVRRPPTYLNDFVSGDGLSDEGEEAKYVMEVLRHFGMEHRNSVENPMVPGFKISKDENGTEMDGSFFKQLIGSMMYLTATRPDIMYALQFCGTRQQIADIFTKPLKLELFRKLKRRLGVCELPHVN